MYNVALMAPAAWRKRERLSLQKLADLLGVKSRETARRYETGEHEAPASIVAAYERVTKDAAGVSQVTLEDLNRVRRSYLRKLKKAA
jgi:predicted transcriptional regulator